jgi:hypothetical protein
LARRVCYDWIWSCVLPGVARFVPRVNVRQAEVATVGLNEKGGDFTHDGLFGSANEGILRVAIFRNRVDVEPFGRMHYTRVIAKGREVGDVLYV